MAKMISSKTTKNNLIFLFLELKTCGKMKWQELEQGKPQ